MLLDNYYQLKTQAGLTNLSGGFIKDLGLQVNTSSGSSVTLRNIDCSGPDRLIRSIDKSFIKTYIPSGTSTVESSYRFIVFGDGYTPVSNEDYSISGSAITNISISSIEGVRTVTGHKIMYNFVYNGTNTANIREVCIFENFANNSTTPSQKVAVWREVFDKPFQVPAGSMFTYIFEVKFT